MRCRASSEAAVNTVAVDTLGSRAGSLARAVGSAREPHGQAWDGPDGALDTSSGEPRARGATPAAFSESRRTPANGPWAAACSPPPRTRGPRAVALGATPAGAARRCRGAGRLISSSLCSDERKHSNTSAITRPNSTYSNDASTGPSLIDGAGDTTASSAQDARASGHDRVYAPHRRPADAIPRHDERTASCSLGTAAPRPAPLRHPAIASRAPQNRPWVQT